VIGSYRRTSQPAIPCAKGPKLTLDSQPVLRLGQKDGAYEQTRTLLFGSPVAGAMLVGIALGATLLAKSSFGPANVSAASTTPSPGFKSNEDPTHEKSESAAREAAENAGTKVSPTP